MQRTFPYALALALSLTLGASSLSLGAEPSPPVVAESLTPYQQIINITIADGSQNGSDNGNVGPGTQTLLIPLHWRLVVQSVTMYRTGGAVGSTVQVFINTNVNGVYAAHALPGATKDGSADYTGATFNGVFYADNNTRLLANAYRNSTTGAESVTVSVSGYLVKRGT